jgi:hypothetical protein
MFDNILYRDEMFSFNFYIMKNIFYLLIGKPSKLYNSIVFTK